MQRISLDLDVLRSFSIGMELGSFAKAADRLGRSTSAISAQLRKLEEQAGTAIFRKSGRSLALTHAGEILLGYARRLLDLNDEANSALRGAELEGWVRLGLQEDFGETLLPEVLGQFARAHPKVKIEARVARNAELLERVTSGRLDLALAWDDGVSTAHMERVAEWPLRWIGAAEQRLPWKMGEEPLPLVAFEAPCLLRTTALDALDGAGIAWRLSFISPSLGGLWAATAAGLGLTIRTPMSLPASLRALEPGEAGLPLLSKLGLSLHRSSRELAPPAERLAQILLQSVKATALGAASQRTRAQTTA